MGAGVREGDIMMKDEVGVKCGCESRDSSEL